MALKKYKPVTAGMRWRIGNAYAELTTDTPEKSLLEPMHNTAGRNAQGVGGEGPGVIPDEMRGASWYLTRQLDVRRRGGKVVDRRRNVEADHVLDGWCRRYYSRSHPEIAAVKGDVIGNHGGIGGFSVDIKAEEIEGRSGCIACDANELPVRRRSVHSIQNTFHRRVGIVGLDDGHVSEVRRRHALVNIRDIGSGPVARDRDRRQGRAATVGDREVSNLRLSAFDLDGIAASRERIKRSLKGRGSAPAGTDGDCFPNSRSGCRRPV